MLEQLYHTITSTIFISDDPRTWKLAAPPLPHEAIKLDLYVRAVAIFVSSWFHILFEHHNNTDNMAAEGKGLRPAEAVYKVVEDGVPLERTNYPLTDNDCSNILVTEHFILMLL